jgi:phosphotransferase system enzyme I (PtsI)
MLKGAPVSPGIGVGTVYVHKELSLDYSFKAFSGKKNEKKRLKEAMEKFLEDAELMAAELRERVGPKEAEIVEAHAGLLQDPYLGELMDGAIEEGKIAEEAVSLGTDEVAKMFLALNDEMMRARSQDMYAVRDRMLRLLLYGSAGEISSLKPGTVFVVSDLTPYMASSFKKENIEAILTEIGGQTSHSAILARAMSIPAVMGISGVTEGLNDGQEVIVDGDMGDVISDPSDELVKIYQKRKNKWLSKLAALRVFKDKPTKDKDGNLYFIMSNITGLREAELALENGTEGVGLFRTEILFMDRDSPPTEEEQLETYKKVAEVLGDKELIIRTIDIGGDKEVPYLKLPKEPNPFLGYRAIRFSLDQPEYFKTQIRAILRAGFGRKNIKIMLPLITGLDELLSAKALIEKEKNSLKDMEVLFNPNIAVGVMVETPAAVQLASILAKEADFFSIGTNDLTQYTLAADRLNPKVGNLYSHFHPAVIKSVEQVVKAAKEAGVPVGMCGEAAGAPGLIPLYMTFGLDEWSVNPASVLAVRKEISLWSLEEAKKVTQKAMTLLTTEAVREFLTEALRERDELLG